MKTLILYSSHDGQTKKIAHFLAQHIEGEVEVRSISDEFSLEVEKIIIGASIRYGHFDKLLEKFIQKHIALLNEVPSAFFGVNLTARKEDKNTPETNIYVRKFLARIPWKPSVSAVFAGALLYPKYNWFDRIMIKLIMTLTDGETDTSKEVEYTNWENVREFAQKLKELKI